MLSLNEFNEQVNIAIPYLKANLSRLKYSEELTKKLEDYLVQWNAIYPLAENKKSRTSTMIADRNTLRDSFEKAYRSMQQSLKNNDEIELTNDDYNSLFIHIDKNRSHNKPPEDIPSLDIIDRRENTLIVQVSNKNPKSAINYTHMPKGWQVNVFVAIVSVDSPEPTDEDYHLFTTTGKSNVTLIFEHKYQNMMAYIRAEFFNKNGKSEMSNSVNSVIPN